MKGLLLPKQLSEWIATMERLRILLLPNKQANDKTHFWPFLGNLSRQHEVQFTWLQCGRLVRIWLECRRTLFYRKRDVRAQ